MSQLELSRRTVLAGLAGITAAVSLGREPRAAESVADWGWPLVYEQISDGSVAWLKEKGWWPLSVGYQPPWTGHNTLNIVLQRLELLQKRGIQAQFVAFDAGPPLIEAFTAGRIQVGGSGNFPYLSLVDRKVPVKGIINYSLLTHGVVVANDSPFRTLTDLKGAASPHTVGIVTGSSAEFYFQAAAVANGVEIGKDVILKNIPLSEQLQLPRGVAAVVPWDHTLSLLTDDRKTGRMIDSSHAYSIYEGIGFVRQELVEHVPDVVQALADAYIEAALWIRLRPAEAVELVRQDPSLKTLDAAFIAGQVASNNNLFKPTALIPLPRFWAAEDGRVRAWLKERNRLTRDIGEAEYAATYAPQFAVATAAKLGWKVPERPVFLPAGWSGTIGTVPYPDYFNQTTAKQPQPFPEAGDLQRSWAFGGKSYQP
jgi:sulfonate transport system substrate-binding protein